MNYQISLFYFVSSQHSSSLINSTILGIKKITFTYIPIKKLFFSLHIPQITRFPTEQKKALSDPNGSFQGQTREETNWGSGILCKVYTIMYGRRPSSLHSQIPR